LFLSGRGVEVVGVIGQAGDVLVSAAATRPDVVLVDCRLAGEPVEGLVAGLKCGVSGASVIVLGTSEDEVASQQSCADGFCAMGDAPDTLLALMREVRSTSP
jgi:DNA-binding NarL/FixJ family response regulator